jgi:hypothetical protein
LAEVRTLDDKSVVKPSQAQQSLSQSMNLAMKLHPPLEIDAGARAVAVILSGLADDGSGALGAIKAGGGVTFAQADAEWPDMPSHAVKTGFVDFVLSSENIGRALSVNGQLRTTPRRSAPDPVASELVMPWSLRHVRSRTGVAARRIVAPGQLGEDVVFKTPSCVTTVSD